MLIEHSEELDVVSESAERMVDGTLAVDVTVFVPPGVIGLGGPHRPRIVAEDNFRVKPELQQRNAADGKGSTDTELSRYAMSLAAREDLSEEEKIARLMEASKLARLSRLIDIGLHSPDKEALRALTRLRDEEEGRPASKKPIDSDDEVESIIWEDV